MTEKKLLNETLSALLDHEAGKTDALELRRLARAMEDDPELAGRYQRFSLASAVMRGDSLTVSTGFLSRVRQGIDGDANDVSKDSGFRDAVKTPWLKVIGQLAVAASVAVVAIVYVQIHRPVETVSVAGTAVLTESRKLGDSADNRLLNPRVLMVSAGNARDEGRQPTNRLLNPEADCVVLEQSLPADSGLRQLRLPEDYVLCRMDENRQRCHAVSNTIACAP